MTRILPYGIGAEMMSSYHLPPMPDIRADFNSNNLGQAGGLRPNKAHNRFQAKVKARKRAQRLGHK